MGEDEMTDRELLELAAKAAGIEHGADRLDSGVSTTESDGRHRHLPRWNPLEDDGDALRLAVKLGMMVEIYQPTDREPGMSYAHTKELLGYGSDGYRAYQAHAYFKEDHGDPYAATRRVITRAAAEIGKEMS